MAGRFAKVLKENRELLESIYGNVEDLIVSDNYNDAMSLLSKMEKENSDYYRYKDVLRRLSGVDFSQISQTTGKSTLDWLNPGIKDSEAYKTWKEYFDNGVASEQQPADFETWLQSFPAYTSEMQQFMTKPEVKTDDQVKAEIFKQAGLNDEDYKFYQEYKPPYTTDYNRRLQSIFSKVYPSLSGRSVGDKYTKMFKDAIDRLALPDEKPEYGVHIDEKAGKVLYYDKNKPWDISTQSYKEAEKEPAKKPDLQNAWKVGTDENGVLGYYGNVWNPETQQFDRVKLRDLSPDEVARYNEQEAQKKKVGKSGRVGSTAMFNPGKLTPEDLAKVTPDMVDKMNLEELKRLKEVKKYLPEATKKRLEERLARPTGDAETETNTTTTQTQTQTEQQQTTQQESGKTYTESMVEQFEGPNPGDEGEGELDQEFKNEFSNIEGSNEFGVDQDFYDSFVTELNTLVYNWQNTEGDTKEINKKKVYDFIGEMLYKSYVPLEMREYFYDIVNNYIGGGGVDGGILKMIQENSSIKIRP